MALQDFDAALELDPKSAGPTISGAWCTHNPEKYSQAVEDLKTAKRLGYNVDPVFIESLEKKAAAKK